MIPVPNHDLVELHSHHPVPQCKTQCFVFTDIDIDLPEIKYSNEKLKSNGSIPSYKKDSSMSSSQSLEHKKGKRIVAIVSGVIGLIILAAGIPVGLQLRSSSLLEARLAFIRRLLSESPLIGGFWNPQLDSTNFTQCYHEVKDNMVGALLWPIRVPCGAQYLDAVQLALEGIDEAKRLVDRTPGIRIVDNAEEMEMAHLNGEIGVLLGLEGHSLGSSLAVLRMTYSLGARFLSMTSADCSTPWASALNTKELLFDENHPNSLTGFGQAVLKECNRLGILVEISHLTEPAMMQVLNSAKAPILISNSSPASLCNNTASIPDHVLSALSSNGGVMTLNIDKLTVKEAISNINYVRAVAGLEHVGLGLSGSPKDYAMLLAELARDRLWSNAALKKLVGGNIVRVLREVEVNKNRFPLSEEWIPQEEVEENAYCRYPDSEISI